MITLALRSSVALLGVVLLGACPDEVEEEHVDVGAACVAGEAEQPHDVSVDFGLCRSSSCEKVVDAACTVTLEGTTLTVEASTTIRHTNDRQCTLDCASVTVGCQTPPLAAGMYTLVYGEDSVALTVPVVTATCTQEWM